MIKIIQKFADLNYMCSKAVFKLLFNGVMERDDENTKSIYFNLLAEAYLTGNYEDNSDLEVFHSN